MVEEESSSALDDALDLFVKGSLKESKKKFTDITIKSPNDADAIFMVGMILMKWKREEEALIYFIAANNIKNDEWLYKVSLADTLFKLRNFADSAQFYNQALALAPDNDRPIHNYADAMIHEKRTAEAIEVCTRTLQACPDNLPSLLALSRLSYHQQDFPAELRYLETAISVAPDNAALHRKLGNALFCQNHHAAAVERLRHALTLKRNKNIAATHVNIAFSLLTLGRFDEGFHEYEWRLDERDVPFPFGRWWGEDLQNKTLLVRAEQGRGDIIQFSRFLTEVKGYRRIIFKTMPELYKLFSTLPAPIEVVCREKEIPYADVECRLLSLPYFLKTRMDTIPPPVRFELDEASLAQWRSRVQALPGLKIGLVWAGNPQYGANTLRSVSLRQFDFLREIDGVSVISLQKEPGSKELSENRLDFPHIHDWTEDLRDFADTAALISNLDLVIAVDTSVAHLAGSLGTPVWVACRQMTPHWVWMLDRPDSPWYPSMRLFRQSSPHDWDHVMRSIETALRDHVGNRAALPIEADGHGRRARHRSGTPAIAEFATA